MRVPASRRLASLSPFAATMLLTAAAFLLPATADHRPARASAGEMKVSAIHVSGERVVQEPAARR